MIDRVQTSALIAVPLASVAVSLVLADQSLSLIWLTSFSGAVSVTYVAVKLFDRWVWRLPILQNWFVKRPILDGDWKFVISSLWMDPQTGHHPEPIEAKATIRQTYTQLHLHLETTESSGNFAASKIVMKDDGTYQIFGVFENRPRIKIQDRSRPHLGALVLDVIGGSTAPCKLQGSYWTDRGTRGEIQGERTGSDLCPS